MSEVQAKFHISVEASSDPKTSVLRMKSIQIVGNDEILLFPVEKSRLGDHVELVKLQVIKNCIKTLRREQFRKIVVTLSKELAAIYLDSEGNIMLRGYILGRTVGSYVVFVVFIIDHI